MYVYIRMYVCVYVCMYVLYSGFLSGIKTLAKLNSSGHLISRACPFAIFNYLRENIFVCNKFRLVQAVVLSYCSRVNYRLLYSYL